jgi:acetyl-CoA C-acetyltransferase
MTTKSVYIVCAKRTATGTLMGSLSGISAPKLGAHVLKAILGETKLASGEINEVILGQVLTGGSGQNPARQSALFAGLPNESLAYTVNKVCGSGLKAVILGAQSILCDYHDIVIAGGQENMSLGMHAAYIRSGQKLGDLKFIDMMQYDGLTDAFSSALMGVTAENVAKKFGVDRAAQDEFSVKSHQKAAAARSSGRFKDEIVPIEIQSKKQTIIFDQDEGIRPDSSMEILSKLKPVFVQDGSVTAGNSSSINDGAAALLLVSEEALRKYNLKPLVRIVASAESGVDPNIMGVGPIPASKKALAKAGWQVSDLDLIECNEAFASQSVYVSREMGWDNEKVNVNGGAIALGHPIGASGARVLVTLVHEMKKRGAKKGLAALCIGGGMGIAICVENCD